MYKKPRFRHVKSPSALRSRIGVSAATFTIVAGLGLALVTAPVPALAEEPGSSTETTGEPSTDGETNSKSGMAIVTNGKTRTVDGDINTTGTSATLVTNGSTLIVNGSISASGEDVAGVLSDSSATVSVTGDVSVSGDESFGVHATGNSDVTVGGNVDASGKNTEGVYVDNSTVTVSGSVTASGEGSLGVKTSDTGSEVIIVNGDVSAETGAWLGSNSTLVVEGTLRGEKVALHLNGSTTVPTIVVGSLETGEGGTLIYSGLPAGGSSASAAINYIVTASGFSVLGTTPLKAGNTTYDVAHEGETLTLTLLDGYKLASGSFNGYDYVENADGTFTITVKSGGGLTFTAESPSLSMTRQAGASDDDASGAGTGESGSATVTIAAHESIPATGDATGAPALVGVALAGASALGAGAHLRRREQ